MRTDLFVTASHKPDSTLWARVEAFAAELGCTTEMRHAEGMGVLFERRPEAQRALVVQKERLLLVDRDGWQFFFHPNLGILRLRNLLRGQHDFLPDAMQLREGDSVLDCTLGYAGEATLCSHIVGDSGEVHGIEGSVELGIVVREGLQSFETENPTMNDAMRRIQVVHLGNHLTYLQACPDQRYDIVYFDPFFDMAVGATETLGPLKVFGDHSPLTAQSVEHARRIARRAVVVKTARWSPLLEQLGITQLHGGKSARVVYGVICAK